MKQIAAIGLAFGFAVSLSGCSRSASPAADNSTSPSSSWSTLGTRAEPAAAATSITSNADAKWVDYNPPATYPNMNTTLSTITMADGTQLSAAVTLPADASGKSVTQALPTIVTLTGYNKNSPGNDAINSYAITHGYAQVVVDVRGTGGSQGQWEAFGATEQGDDRPILDWVVAQPFCNGRIGLYGGSLLAINAALAAAKNHPAVKAAFLIVPMADGYRDIVFTGGQTNLGFIPLWLGLVTADSVLNPEVLQNPASGIPLELTQLLSALTNFQVPLLLKAIVGDSDTVYDGAFWQIRSPIEQANNIHVPTFIVGGLQDIFQRGEPLLYETIKRNAPAKLLIGPWTHIATGNGLPVDGVPVLDHITLQWFDKYLRGQDSGAEQLPNVTQYVYGLGHYVSTTDWPNPQASVQRLYMRGDKSLRAEQPAQGEASNVTLQVPLNGVCSASAAQWTAGALGAVPLPCITDDGLAEALDVHYETAPLTNDLYLNGPIAVDLWVSTTGSDGGVAVRVDDVSGNTVSPLTNGLQTLSMSAVDTTRSRTLDEQIIQPWHTFTQAAQLTVTPGAPMKISVEVFPTSALIKTGHKLRISVGPSDFPHGLPPLPSLVGGVIGALTIYSDAQHVSSVLLPVVPTSTLP
ncbi:CocE/NonD family hydrolase [Stenotrophobium rhamnosiphilum]|uniref:Peptidase S15 n=1 Tax=Stenotrophobium rhamnosiphilum TaxID=2029166 RepID=A0A2T5MIZ8_9GAMM|nr:CocE/NonD family hydrolase [Stenotrophobium rhamnosiphilum]PTU32557.1 peptidase S15 [Stenotrophobium rhamnosiphilum]